MWFKTRIKIYVSVLILNLLIASILIYLVSKVNEENLYKEALNYKYIEKFKVPEFYRVYFNESDKLIHFNNDLDSMFNLNDSEALEIKWTKEYTQSYGRTPPTNYKKWISFAINKKCPLHPNYYSQINKDLMVFRNQYDPKLKTISPEVVDEALTFNINIGGLIVGKNLFYPIYSTDNETVVKLDQLKELITNEVLEILPDDKNITLAYNYHDYPRVLKPDNSKLNLKSIEKQKDTSFRHNNCFKKYYSRYKKNTGFFISNKNLRVTHLVPLFSSCKTICHNDILMPGFHHIREMKNVVDDKVDWKNKTHTFLWRGATTGVGWREIRKKDKYQHFQRMRLLDWATVYQRNHNTTLNTSVNVDVGFTSLHYCEEDICERIKLRYKFKEPLSYTEHFQHKYLLTIDGHSWVSRFQPFLFSNSLIFQCTQFIEWFSFLFRPWLHYVPVDLDFTDLEKNIEWAFTNDKQAREMTETASKMARKHLTMEAMQCYTGLLLLEYGDLLI